MNRIPDHEAKALVAGEIPVHDLGKEAGRNRRERYGIAATFVRNLQVNPTNLCHGACAPCGFAAREGDARAYVLNEEEILEKVTRQAPSEVHLVGGLSRTWPFARCLTLVKRLKENLPNLFIKGFTAVEIDWFVEESGLDLDQVLSRLARAGVDALPGGGAEIFAPRVRNRFFSKKISGERWLAIHRRAHALGLPTNATMIYGLDETWTERVEHLLALRRLQDESGGFVSFVPLPLQPGKLKKQAPSPLENLLVTALARLILDNIPHIKAYWPMLGLTTARLALGWGADDLDGTIGGERIAHAAGSTAPEGITPVEAHALITAAGFQSIERFGNFSPCTPASPSSPI